jgi:hypothetical protein
MVLGGCCVSPSAETGIPENINELDDKMQAASHRLEQCYALERAEVRSKNLPSSSSSTLRSTNPSTPNFFFVAG